MSVESHALLFNPSSQTDIHIQETPVQESVYQLAASLMNDPSAKTIALTSADNDAVKTALVGNLGLALAQTGNKVLLIDANFRNPSLQRFFNIPNSRGLASHITGAYSKEEITKSLLKVHHLDVILTGHCEKSNPLSLIHSEKLKQLISDLRESYDYILINTPELSEVTDAAVLGKMADGVLLMLTAKKTEMRNAMKSHNALAHAGVNLIGAVMMNHKVIFKERM